MNYITRLLTLMVIISSIAALSTSGLQIAFANSPSVSADPAPMLVGTGQNKITLSSSNDNSKPHTDVKIEVGEPTVSFAGDGTPETSADPPVDGSPGGTCTLPAVSANPNTRSVWVLRDAATGTVDVKLTTGTVGNPGSISIPFKPGTVTITSSGGAAAVGNPTSGQWVDITINAAPAAINFVGSYKLGHCGYDGFGQTGSQNSVYGTAATVPAQLPVGGEIIPISATALILAGMSTNTLWLIPLGAIAGGAFAVLRFQVMRK